jgi:thiol:disulfide interchange protein DsbD
VVLLQANVTANNTEQAALLKHLRVIGLPTILFFNGTGEELAGQRITRFMDAPMFNSHL